jgi:hypothetical protein
VRHHPVNFDPALDYHIYAIEWTPEYIAWFIDGIEVYRQTEDFVKTVTRAQKLMFNMWIPQWTNWMGVFTEQILPAYTFYDWASYYSYTQGKGNYGSGNNFTLNWRDEFDSFDPNRWVKATHTWEGNNSDMSPDNISFAGGKMILSLTTMTELGYNDKKPPTIITARSINETKVQVFFSEEIEKTTAETASKYILAGMPPTKKATLLKDNRTVELDVEKLDLTSLPNLILLGGIKDKANPINSSIPLAKAIIPTPQLKFPIKINVGGNEYNGFIADREFKTDTSNFGFMEGTKATFTSDIANTSDDPVYQTEINGLAKYILRIPNGKYRVTLLFAENYYNSTGKRVFDIYLEGNLVIKGLDIVKEVGTKRALEKVIDNVEVNDYLLDIHFAAQIERPLLNGIIIESLTPSDVKVGINVPNEFKLLQNYPNPFNPDTSISYHLSNSGFVSLKIFNSLGSEIATLVNEFQNCGIHNSQFSIFNSELSSGIYFYTLRADNYAQTKKMLLLK